MVESDAQKVNSLTFDSVTHKKGHSLKHILVLILVGVGGESSQSPRSQDFDF